MKGINGFAEVLEDLSVMVKDENTVVIRYQGQEYLHRRGVVHDTYLRFFGDALCLLDYLVKVVDVDFANQIVLGKAWMAVRDHIK